MPGDLAATFLRDGVVILRRAFNGEDASLLRQQIWHHVESKTPVRRRAPNTWGFSGNFGLRRVKERRIWDTIHGSPAVTEALDEILGAGEWDKPGPPQILLTFPSRGPWQLPTGWHVDFGADLPTWPVAAPLPLIEAERTSRGRGLRSRA